MTRAPSVRGSLLTLLTWLGRPQAILAALPHLERLFTPQEAPELAEHPSWLGRWLASRLLAQAGLDPEVEDALLWRLADDPERFVREGVAEALARLWQRAPDQALALPGRQDLTPRRRRVCLLALVAYLRRPRVHPRVVQTLVPWLLDGKRPGDGPTVDTLLRLLVHHDPDLALAAASPAWPEDWATTREIPVPSLRLAQVVGQPHGVAVIRLAARQRRFVLLVGEPGTGKSMLGEALAELLLPVAPQDVLLWPNPEQAVTPRVEVVPAGQGPRVVAAARRALHHRRRVHRSLVVLLLLAAAITGWVAWRFTGAWAWPAALLVLAGLVGRLGALRVRPEAHLPRLLVRGDPYRAPFVDATGFHAGALLGDVRHDPFQSGGRETPPHHLVEAGAIHQAHGGVLFIDEAGTLAMETQQSLLTGLQARQLPITGRSPGSSGSMVRTDPVPCDVVLVLAGNREDVEQLHPALRSRIRGYGYEVLMATEMPDTPENRRALVRFVAQEVRNDGRIPHFTREAVEAVLVEAARRASPGHLTLRLRELGGLVRAAGDQAVLEGAPLVEASHVERAVSLARPLEEQERVPAGGQAPSPPLRPTALSSGDSP